MSTISVTNINDGDAVTAASINNQVNTIVNDYNGNITAANLAANAVTDAKITANNLLASKFSNPYKFSVYRNAAQNTTSGAYAKVNLDTKGFDTGTNFDAVTNFRFTAPVAGFYFLSGAAQITTGAGAIVFAVALYKNGVANLQGGTLGYTSAAGGTASIASGLISLAANDYIELFIFANGVYALSVGATQTYLQGFLVSSI